MNPVFVSYYLDRNRLGPDFGNIVLNVGSRKISNSEEVKWLIKKVRDLTYQPGAVVISWHRLENPE